MIDLTQYDDTDLDTLRVEILTEQERRANQARIPAEVAQLAQRYKDGGGDTADLTAAIDAIPPM